MPLCTEQLEDRIAPAATLSLPASGFTGATNSTVMNFPIGISALSDGAGHVGLASATLAVTYPVGVFQFPTGGGLATADVGLGAIPLSDTAGTGGASDWILSANSPADGQLNVTLTAKNGDKIASNTFPGGGTLVTINFPILASATPGNETISVVSVSGSVHTQILGGGSGSQTYQLSGLPTSGTIVVTAGLQNPPSVPATQSYSTEANTPVSQAAPGVLTGASDPQGEPLSVAMVNGSAGNVGFPATLPSGATLTVRADGSFVYSPASNFVGSDSFTLQAVDTGGSLSNTGIVTIEMIPTLSIVPRTISAGPAGTEIEEDIYLDNPDPPGGAGPLSAFNLAITYDGTALATASDGSGIHPGPALPADFQSNFLANLSTPGVIGMGTYGSGSGPDLVTGPAPLELVAIDFIIVGKTTENTSVQLVSTAQDGSVQIATMLTGAGGTFAINPHIGPQGSAFVPGVDTLVSIQGAMPLTLGPASLPSGDYEAAYDQTITASGGTAPYSYALFSGTLPPGLMLDGDSGVIAGTAIAAGSYLFTIRATDADGIQGTRTYPLTTLSEISITTPALPDWTATQPGYRQTISAVGGVAPFTFTTSAGNLPPGLTLSSDGTLSGTPSAAGSYTFTVTATDSTSASGSQIYSLTINPALAITTATLLNVMSGVAYNQTVLATGGTGSLTFSSSGTLPPGLTLSSTGALFGTPTTGGSYTFTVTVTDTVNASASQIYTIIIDPITITTSTLPDWTANVPGYADIISTSGGLPPVTFRSTGTLPTGLSLTSDGYFYGTPTVVGAFSFTLIATDSLSDTGSRAFTVVINPAVSIGTPVLPPWTAGQAGYLQTIVATGGTGSLTASTSGGLPPGLTMSSTGVLAGMPTTPGSFSFAVTFNDTLGSRVSQGYTLTINPPVTIATRSLPSWTVNQPGFNQTINALGGTGTLVFAATGTLPPGLALSTTGVLSGTPTTTGIYQFTVMGIDTTGAESNTQSYTVIINPSPMLAATNPGPWNINQPGFVYTVAAIGGTAPLTYSASGTLPPGLMLNTLGALFGTPSASGRYTFTVIVSDAAGASSSGNLTVTINAVLGPTSLPNWTVSQAGYNQILTLVGGVPPLTFSATGTLPPGLTLTTAGVLSGTPTATGSYTFTVTATDSVSQTASQSYTVVINSVLAITTSTLATGTASEPGYVQQFLTTGGTAPLTFTASGTLPPGLTLSTGGILSGTPTTAGVYTLTVTARDAAGASAQRTYTFTIAPLLPTGTLIPVVNATDMVFDSTRNLLYITTTNGTIQRYSLTTQTFLTPFTTDGYPESADITPDGSALYVTDLDGGPGQGIVQQVNLSTGAVTDLFFVGGDSNSYSIALGPGGTGLFDTNDIYSGAVRQINEATNTITLRGDTPAGAHGTISRSADRKVFLIEEGGGTVPFYTYNALTKVFSKEYAGFDDTNHPLTAVNRNGTLFAVQNFSAEVFDQNFNQVQTLSAIDSGVIFDPFQDLMYGLDSATNQVIAYDTDTWAEKFTLQLNGKLGSLGTYSNNFMTVSNDGSYLFVAMGSGVAMIPLPSAVSATRFAVTGAAAAESPGTTSTVTVTALNAAGTTASVYTGTIHFSSSDSAAGLPADYTFMPDDHGIHTFNLTLNTIGAQSITVTDPATSVTGQETGINIGQAGVASQLLLSAPGMATAGSSFSVTVSAEDVFGNVVPGYGATVSFMSSDGQAVLPHGGMLINGVAPFSFTLGTMGSQTISAMDQAQPGITGTSPPISVSPGPTAQFALGTPETVTGGTPFPFTITAEDAYQNPTPAYSGIVHFSSSDPGAILPADTMLMSGTGSFMGTFKTAGSQTVIANDKAKTNIKGQSSRMTTYAADTLIPVTNATDLVFDPSRNLLYITTSDGTIQRYSIAAQTLLTSFSTNGDTQSADITPDDSTLYVTDQDGGLSQGILQAVNLATGAVTDLFYVSDDNRSYSVALGPNGSGLFDASGYSGSLRQINEASNTITVRSDAPGSTDGLIVRSADRSLFLAMQASGTVPFYTYNARTNTFSQAYALGFDDSNHPLAAVNRNGTLFAVQGAYAEVFDKTFNLVQTLAGVDSGVAFDPIQDVLYGLDSATDQVIAYDTNTWTIKFELSPGALMGSLATYNDNFSTVSSDGRYLFVGTSAGIVEVPLPSAVTATGFLATGAARPVSVGSTSTITITALNAAGTVASGYIGTVHFSSSDMAAGLPADYTFVSGDQGVHTFNVTLNTIGMQSITVTDQATGASGRETGITVGQAGLTSTFLLSVPASVTAGNTFSVTVSAEDLFGNPLTSFGGTISFTSSDGKAILPLTGMLMNGVGTFSFTMGTVGKQTLTATNQAQPVITGTSAPVSVMPGPTTQFAFSTPSIVTGGMPFHITVTAEDAYQNPTPAYSGTLHLSSSDPAALLPADTTLSSGTGSFTVTLTSSGSQTLSAQDKSTTSIAGQSSAFTVYAGGTLIPLSNATALVFDPTRNLLYITTSNGTIQRYSLATHALLTPIALGGNLQGADITADGSALYVTDFNGGTGQGILHKVSLSTGTVTDLYYTGSDSNAYSIAMGPDGSGLFDTGGYYGLVRQINESSNTLTVRSDAPGFADGTIARSADRSLFLLKEGGSPGPFYTYNALTNTFSKVFSYGVGQPSQPADAVNRNGTLLAIIGGYAQVYDNNFNLVQTVASIDVGMAFDPVKDLLYGINNNSDQLIAYDTNTWSVQFRIPLSSGLGTGSKIMALSNDGGYLFVAGSSGVGVIPLPGVSGSITITTPALANWTVNYPGYGQTIGAGGGTGTLTFAVSAGALPVGLTLTSNGALSGTPTSIGSFAFTVTATDTTGTTASKIYTVTINPTPKITSISVPNGEVGVAYQGTILASGGTGSLTFSATALPAGLTLSTGGVLAGNPTSPGSYNVTIAVTDFVGANVVQNYSVTILPAFRITTTTLAGATVGVVYSQAINAAGGTPPYTFSPYSPAPTNLIVNGDFEAGNTGFTSQYTYSSSGNLLPQGSYDVASDPSTANPYWTVYGDHTTGHGLMLLLNGATNANVAAWSETVAIVPGTNYVFSLWDATSYPSSPATLAIQFNGVTIGTTTAPLSAGIWQQFTTSWNSGSAISVAITIYDTNLAASGNDLALDDISLVGPSTAMNLPPGLSLSTNGVLAGTPTAVGSYPFGVTVTDAAGATASQVYTVIIGPPSIVYVDPTFAGEGKPATDPDLGLVDGVNAFSTIAAGLDNVAPGGTLVIFGGTYSEPSVNFNVPLTSVDIATNPSDPVALSSVVISGAVALSSDTIFDLAGVTTGTGVSTAANLVFESSVDGSGSMTVNGSATLTFQGPVSAGVSIVGGLLDPTDTFTLAGSGSLSLAAGLNETIGALASTSSTSSVQLGSSSNLTTGVGGSSTFAGSIMGPGQLTKVGMTTFTLSGNSTYTGPTSINQGTLTINGLLGAASNPVILTGSTSVLDGTGSVLRPVIITSAASGAMIGGTLTISSPGGIAIDVDAGPNNATINGITVTGSNVGILAEPGSGNSLIITDCTISGNVVGLEILNGCITATGNVIGGAAGMGNNVGVYLPAVNPNNAALAVNPLLTLEGNQIVGNTTAVQNATTMGVTAILNWWGSTAALGGRTALAASNAIVGLSTDEYTPYVMNATSAGPDPTSFDVFSGTGSDGNVYVSGTLGPDTINASTDLINGNLVHVSGSVQGDYLRGGASNRLIVYSFGDNAAGSHDAISVNGSWDAEIHAAALPYQKPLTFAGLSTATITTTGSGNNVIFGGGNDTIAANTSGNNVIVAGLSSGKTGAPTAPLLSGGSGANLYIAGSVDQTLAPQAPSGRLDYDTLRSMDDLWASGLAGMADALGVPALFSLANTPDAILTGTARATILPGIGKSWFIVKGSSNPINTPTAYNADFIAGSTTSPNYRQAIP